MAIFVFSTKEKTEASKRGMSYTQGNMFSKWQNHGSVSWISRTKAFLVPVLCYLLYSQCNLSFKTVLTCMASAKKRGASGFTGSKATPKNVLKHIKVWKQTENQREHFIIPYRRQPQDKQRNGKAS